MRVEGLRPLLPVLLALWPGPRTYTGQNVAEIHLPGATPLVSLVLADCLARGARLAEPGEFTLRAFLGGRIDLTRAEAVLGVIDARNKAQLDAALEQLAGGLSGPILTLRDRLLDVLAQLEANLDFTEEPDVDPIGRAALADELAASAAELRSLAQRLNDRDRPESLSARRPGWTSECGQEPAVQCPSGTRSSDRLAPGRHNSRLLDRLMSLRWAHRRARRYSRDRSARDTIADQAQALRVQEAGRADLLLVCRSIELSDDGTGLASEPERPSLTVWTQCDRGMPDPSIGNATAMIMTSAATGLGHRDAAFGDRGDHSGPRRRWKPSGRDRRAMSRQPTRRRGGLAFVVGSVARRRGR